MASHTVLTTSIFPLGHNTTLDGRQTKLEHSNLTGTAKSEIKIIVSRKYLGLKLHCLVEAESLTSVLETSVQIGNVTEWKLVILLRAQHSTLHSGELSGTNTDSTSDLHLLWEQFRLTKLIRIPFLTTPRREPGAVQHSYLHWPVWYLGGMEHQTFILISF